MKSPRFNLNFFFQDLTTGSGRKHLSFFEVFKFYPERL